MFMELLGYGNTTWQKKKKKIDELRTHYIKLSPNLCKKETRL